MLSRTHFGVEPFFLQLYLQLMEDQKLYVSYPYYGSMSSVGVRGAVHPHQH